MWAIRLSISISAISRACDPCWPRRLPAVICRSIPRATIFSRCRALIFPGEEDFGITPVEAQAAGRPVIAYAGGGALDTVKDGVTGKLFHPQTPEALAEAVKEFDQSSYNPIDMRKQAERFDTAAFNSALSRWVQQRYSEHQQVATQDDG